MVNEKFRCLVQSIGGEEEPLFFQVFTTDFNLNIMKYLCYFCCFFFLSCQVKQEELSPFYLVQSLPESTTSLEAVRSRVQQAESGFVQFSSEEDSLWLQDGRAHV